MSNKQLGPLEVVCEAPPYPIVQACNAIGVETPEDVRWVKYPPKEMEEKKPSLLASVFRKEEVPLCNCREALPKLAKYRFTYSSGDEVTYSVGQCRKCRAVYWTEG